MCFWSHGQSFSGKVYETKVIVHLPNSKVGQVLTHKPIPLPLPRVGGPKWAQGNYFCGLKPPTQLQASKAKLACQELKIADIPI
jgi:hypothetical protein